MSAFKCSTRVGRLVLGGTIYAAGLAHAVGLMVRTLG